MRRGILALLVCAAALAGGATTANAQVFSGAQEACVADAEWRVTIGDDGTGHADLTYATVPGACRRIVGTIHDTSPNFNVHSESVPQASSVRYEVTGEGDESGFVGELFLPSTGARGPIVIAGDALTAVVTRPDKRMTTYHQPEGSCGEGCWATLMTWTRNPL